MEISPSGVAPVCQAEDQLELTCTSSGAAHRWEFTIFPENMTYPTAPIISAGTSGAPQPLTFSSSVITFLRLSGQGSSPLISRARVSSVSSDLNGAVVNCFEGISSTVSVATTTIRIIDPGQLGKTPYTIVERVCMLHHPQSISMIWCSWLVAMSTSMHADVVYHLSFAFVQSCVPTPCIFVDFDHYLRRGKQFIVTIPHKSVTPLKCSNWRAGPR